MAIEVDSYGFPKTEGIFETIKTVNGAALELTRHMRRAVKSAHVLGITLPSEAELRAKIAQTISDNPHPIGRLRICLYSDGCHISHDSYEEPPNPLRLTIHSQTVMGFEHKQFPYDERFAIIDAAKREGYDDAILLNSRNEITETAVSNLILLISGIWVTPPIGSGALPGIIRGIAIEKCNVKVRDIHISEIPEIESAHSLASLRIAQPISHIGDMKLHIGKPSRDIEAAIRSHLQAHSVG